MSGNLKITNVNGDLTIDPPDNSIVIHAVNCLGEWGSGVALALKRALPGAYVVYKDWCKEHPPEALLGDSLLIPPQKSDYDLTASHDKSLSKPRIWVYCLFVSEGYGRRTKTKPGKSKPGDIMKYTRKALERVRHVLLNGQIGALVDWDDELCPGDGPNTDVVWTCKFNSGSFGIKWETTLEIIEEVFADESRGLWKGELQVVSHG